MKVFVINGYPRSGKDTFVTYCKNLLKGKNIPAYDFSTITPIKLAARQFGWSGQKDPASRKMLADIRKALTEWNNYSFNYIKKSILDMEKANRPLSLDIQLKTLGISVIDDNGLFKTLPRLLYEVKKMQNFKDKTNETHTAEKEIDQCFKKEGRYKNYEEGVYFIYCREPEEIQKYVDFFHAITVLIDRGNVDFVDLTSLSNDADKAVLNYRYDYVIENNDSFEVLRESAETLLKELKII